MDRPVPVDFLSPAATPRSVQEPLPAVELEKPKPAIIKLQACVRRRHRQPHNQHLVLLDNHLHNPPLDQQVDQLVDFLVSQLVDQRGKHPVNLQVIQPHQQPSSRPTRQPTSQPSA